APLAEPSATAAPTDPKEAWGARGSPRSRAGQIATRGVPSGGTVERSRSRFSDGAVRSMSVLSQNFHDLKLGFEGVAWADLHRPEGLRALHERFEAWLAAEDAEAHARLARWRESEGALAPREVSATIVAVSPHIGRFVAR